MKQQRPTHSTRAQIPVLAVSVMLIGLAALARCAGAPKENGIPVDVRPRYPLVE